MGLDCAMTPVNGAQVVPRSGLYSSLVSTTIPSSCFPAILYSRARGDSRVWRRPLGIMQEMDDAQDLRDRPAKGSLASQQAC